MYNARYLLTTSLFLLSYSHKSFANDYSECCSPPIPMFGEVTLFYDDFRGIAEGSWNGNTGGVIEANFGCTLFDSIGVQIGGSYGVYDWYGRGNRLFPISQQVQQQGFITGGLFHKALCCDGNESMICCNGIQGGVVVDWMFNKNFGVFGLDPSFGQLRYQLSYMTNGQHEFGAWGSSNIGTGESVRVFFKAISQVSLFWRCIFENHSELMLWGGVPYKKSLLFPKKRAGQFVIGANFRAPLTERLTLEAHGAYMGPAERGLAHAFLLYDANVSIGITYSFPMRGKNCCKQARPYLPVANNSNFFVDTDLTD